MIDYYRNRMNLVLPGAGFLGAIGVLMQVWPNHPFEKVSGTSCGGIIATTLAAGLALEETVLGYYKILDKIKVIGLSETVRKVLEEKLPIKAHKLVSGNIGISITRWKDFASTILTHFDRRSDLIDAVVAGCFIPLWSGKLMPSYQGTKYFDGAWTDNAPKLDIDECDRTKGVYHVVICPFNGDVDVCPDDEHRGFGLMSSFGIEFYFSFTNIYRSMNAIFTPKPETVDRVITQGHDDMKRYLLRDNLLKCRLCHQSDNSDRSPNNIIIEIPEKKSACLRCLLLKEEVSNLKVPIEILSKNQLRLMKNDKNSIDSMNKTLIVISEDLHG